MVDVKNKRLMILAGSHYPELADRVAEKLGIRVSNSQFQRFANGEIKFQLDESVRGADVFIFQAHNGSVAEAIVEQAVLIDAAKRASADHITAVCPFFGYARQDRKSKGREPITAKLVVDILSVAGADRIVSVDLHSGQIQGFFNGPFDHLIALPEIARHIKKNFDVKDVVMVSPDAGRVKLTERYASRLGVDIAIVHKRRVKNNEAEAVDVIGDIKGKHCVINDDMIDTAGTICVAAELLKQRGAKKVSVVATHGLFSGPAIKRIEDSQIDYLAVTDTLPLPEELKKSKKVEVISVVGLISKAISAIYEDRSVSILFDGENHS